MPANRRLFPLLLVAVASSFLLFISVTRSAAQIVQPPEKVEPGQHQHAHHHLHIPMGEETCAVAYTYEDGPLGPSHWPSVCATGKMQSPIDIQQAQKLPIDTLKISYRPADLDIINDCNQFRILIKFPDNYWLTVGKKPYNLAEIHFRVPGENAVEGKRPPMSIQFVHYSPEGVFLIIEVPVVAGKENPLIKTLWQHMPAKGKENKIPGVQIDPSGLLPADRGFYRFPGSLTTPICNEVVNWYLMKNPIELSEAQIAEYSSQYHDVARPLQPLNGRPVVEGQ